MAGSRFVFIAALIGVAGFGGAAALWGGEAAEPGGLLHPQQNEVRNLLDLSGLWDFQLDPAEKGEAAGWFKTLPAPRPIPVPCSWNDLFDDARDYLGLAWYRREVIVPAAWRGQRVFLRVGSANYAAKAWVNGAVVAEHLGGHLPFEADISGRIVWDRPNVIAISVENKQLPDRVPPGPAVGGGGDAGPSAGYPATTYDFFPYAGLHGPVALYAVSRDEHIDDIAVVTTIEGRDGLVKLKVVTAGPYTGKGRVRLNGRETGLSFLAGSAEATLRVPAARFWSPDDPHLYPLDVALTSGDLTTDAYSLGIGIRTIAVRGEQLLLNGRPIKLRGFGLHQDFPMSGRGLNLPLWARDFELLKSVGANSFRTSHYPCAEEALQLADRLGFLVIDEIPAAGLSFEDPDRVIAARLEQATGQLRELIARDKNHPSVIMWSLADEPTAGPPLGLAPPVPKAIDAGKRFFRDLYNKARETDGTRPVTLVGVQGGPREWLALMDVACVNAHYGWHTQPGQLELGRQALARELDALHKEIAKPVIVTGFGGEALPGAHGTPPDMGTEEYQVELLRGFLDAAAVRPFVAGLHVSALADFKTGQGTGRTAATNFTGVFTRDRKPKMAAHFLRSRWTGK